MMKKWLFVSGAMILIYTFWGMGLNREMYLFCALVVLTITSLFLTVQYVDDHTPDELSWGDALSVLFAHLPLAASVMVLGNAGLVMPTTMSVLASSSSNAYDAVFIQTASIQQFMGYILSAGLFGLWGVSMHLLLARYVSQRTT